MILIIDNYDSFTYNLVQYFGELGVDLRVVMNDEVTVEEIRDRYRPEKIVISPGPGTPDDAGISLGVILALAPKLPVLGVCLGHQAIAQAFGGRITVSPQPIHGKSSKMSHTGSGLFEGLRNPLSVGRYHSLVVDRSSLPADLQVTAETDDGIVMGLRHRILETHGVQFHPESILTDSGRNLLQNFLAI